MLRRNPRGQVEDKISSAINKDNDEHHGLFGGKKKKVRRAHQTLLGTCCATAAPDTSRLQQKQVSGDGLLPWENNKPSDDKWLNNDVSALPASACGLCRGAPQHRVWFRVGSFMCCAVEDARRRAFRPLLGR